MTQEEKAIAYDEAVKRAKAAIDVAADKDLVGGVVKTILPELRESESEDERIRKALINLVCTVGEYYLPKLEARNKMLDYLEKQKEQKPVEYLPKRKVYDIMNKLTELSTSDLIPIESEEYVKIHEITSDVCSLLDYPIEQKPTECEDCAMYLSGNCTHPNGKCENVKSKQEWSEEDETRLTNILIMLKEYVIHHYSKDDVDKSVDWLENRFKSLRPQYHGDVTMTEAYKMGLEAGKASSWKPSEEQMAALEAATVRYQSTGLESLYEELKKQV